MQGRARVLAAGLVLSSSLFASPALAVASPRTVAFSGHYTGTASLLINNGAVTITAVHGKGTGTLVGASSVSGSGTAAATEQCNPFGGTGSISSTTAKIDLTVAKSTSSGCSSGQSGPVTVTFNGVAKATGGSGKAKGARGSLRFKGVLKLAGTSGSQQGTFTVSLTGKLSFES